MRFSRLIGTSIISVLSVWSPVASAEDQEGCKDLWVTRMPGFSLSCVDSNFDSYEFAAGTNKAVTVEGRIIKQDYSTEAERPPSRLAVRRNYEKAFRDGGWTVVIANEDDLTVSQKVNGQERWAQLSYNDGNRYQIILGQKGEMVQSVESVADMLTALNKDGRVALQVNFDTAKATIKPDSQTIISRVVELLQSNPELKLSVEGHTDNVGKPETNRILSESRARAVVAALVSRGIAPSRLTSAGFGPDRPVADNSTEEGRAKNRRVELVRR